jgi:8-oxo-dGTP diphosphatase
MDCKEKSRGPILAAGGIVLRNDLDSMIRFAVVRSRKLDTWGLPKGKLAAGEDALTAARREVLEETGHRVSVHEFLGTLVYETSRRPKVVSFWRMEAAGPPEGVLMRDVKAVDWLVLRDAVDRLSHLRERVFLEQVGPIALKHCRSGEAFRRGFVKEETRGILVPGVPLAPEDATQRSGWPPPGRQLSASPTPPARGPAADEPEAPERAARGGAGHPGTGYRDDKSLAGKTLMRKTWGWFRHAALSHRQLFD